MIPKNNWRILLLSWSVLLCLVMQAGPASAKDHKAAADKIRALNDQIIAANEKNDVLGALKAAEKAVEVAKEEYGKDSLEVADTMNNLANLYLYANRAPEAEQIFKRAILIDLEKLDKNGTEMADLYFNLAVAYAMEKQYMAAIDILNKALVIRQEKLGPENVATKKTKEMIEELTKRAGLKTEKI